NPRLAPTTIVVLLDKSLMVALFRCSGELYVAGCGCASAAYWRSSTLAAPLPQFCAMDCDKGSGKMSSCPSSSPSNTARATDSGAAFGMSRPRVLSVSTGPVNTACTVTPRSASSTRNDCVRLNAAALETEYAGMIGNGASALTDRLLTSAPCERVNSGRNPRVTAYGPNRLTRKCCSSTAGSVRSSYT